jgi:hypothetical protein
MWDVPTKGSHVEGLVPNAEVFRYGALGKW